MPDPSSLEQRIREYKRLYGIELDFEIPLGFGQDGKVWKSNHRTAVKVLERQRAYAIEAECYKRLSRHRVTSIQGFAVPKLVRTDDNLWVVEMHVVRPPYLIDFGKAHLDAPPDFSPEVLADWAESMRELWEDKWPQVQSLLRALQQYGIHYLDAKPGNIRFREDDSA